MTNNKLSVHLKFSKKIAIQVTMLINFKMRIISVKIFMTIMIVTIGWIARDNKFVLKQTDPNKQNEWCFFSFFFVGDQKPFVCEINVHVYIHAKGNSMKTSLRLYVNVPACLNKNFLLNGNHSITEHDVIVRARNQTCCTNLLSHQSKLNDIAFFTISEYSCLKKKMHIHARTFPVSCMQNDCIN